MSPEKKRTLWLVAHRGAMSEAPENTRPAFDRALSYGIDGIEFDVQMSIDDVPVIYHNKTLFRINRKRKRIADYTFRELQEFDWGKWYDEQFKNEQVLTLEEMLKRYGHKTRLMIEIKTDKKESLSGRSHLLARHVVRLIKESIPEKAMDNIFILSFDQEILAQAKSLAPELNIVLNMEEPEIVAGIRASFLESVYAVCGPIKKMTNEVLSSAQKKGLGVMTYSINTPQQFKKAHSLNVDVMMTDRPGWLVQHAQR